jgi:hypothetical protein
MPRKPRLSVTRETSSRRNQEYRDSGTGATMPRAEAVRRIERGEYPGYHVRRIHGVKTPVSNPNGQSSDNLG